MNTHSNFHSLMKCHAGPSVEPTVVSICIFSFYFVSFSYDGVYSLLFFFNCTPSLYQRGTLILTNIFKRSELLFDSNTLFLPIYIYKNVPHNMKRKKEENNPTETTPTMHKHCQGVAYVATY